MSHDICIYLDGSGYEGHIGGAAVLKQNGHTESTLHFDLGSTHHYIVYKGEIAGMLLATKLLRWTKGCISTISLGLEYRVEIQASTYLKLELSHYLMDAFHDNLQLALNIQGIEKTTVRWTPGHTGIPGNKEADLKAKEAAKDNASLPHLLPKFLQKVKNSIKGLLKSKSVAKQCLCGKLKAVRMNIFAISPNAHHAHTIDHTLPSHCFLKLTADLPKKHAVTILFPHHSHLLAIHSFCPITWRGSHCFHNTAYLFVSGSHVFSLLTLPF